MFSASLDQAKFQKKSFFDCSVQTSHKQLTYTAFSLFNKTTSKEPEDLVSEAAILERVFFWIRRRQLKFFFARAARRIVSSQSVGKIMITILNFRVSTSKNKLMINLKKLVLLGLYKFIYETNLISLLRGSTIQNVLNVCLFMYFIGI